MSTGFYADLPAVDEFEAFSDPACYRPLPDDWHVVIGDIRGSTKAIGEGRYKDVNMVGAACITAALNVLKGFDPVPDVPYVFGGDGATLAIPAHTVDAVKGSLVRTQALSNYQFGLGLRVGIVPVAHVRERGGDILVAKYQLSPGNCLAMFTGGGIEMVDALLKDDDEGAPYRAEARAAVTDPDLEGLSCRWQPIAARRGQMVSMLILSTDTDLAQRTETYRMVTERINETLGGRLIDFSPATNENLRFYWPPTALLTEARTTAAQSAFGVFGRVVFILLQSALQWVLHKTGGKAGAYDADAYKQELITNSDFRRFDDTLRLVLDCTREQVAALEGCLADLRDSSGIAYGLHTSDTALMTCLVFSLEESQHVHFIDGGDGGFAVAAKQLKAQLAEGD